MIRINTQPSRRQLRQFAGLVFPLFCGLIGTIAYFRFDAPPVAYAIWAGGAVVSALGLAIPAFARLVFVGLMVVTYPIGFVVSHVVLVILFYGIMMPVGLALRVSGKDPLRKGPDPEAATYWRPREAVTQAERYFRQY